MAIPALARSPVGHHPVIEAQLLGLASRAAAALDAFRQPMSTATLTELARRRTRLVDFGDHDFEAPLEVLIKSYEEEADLNTFGRMAARWDVERFLSNLLLLRSAEKREPAILQQSIKRPVFITGLPRSGTTFLHELLGRDPSNRIVRCWETIYPYATRFGRSGDPDDRRRKVDRQLALFARLAPEIQSLHPIRAESGQECSEITGHVLTSSRFDSTHHVPAYRRWLDMTDQTSAYQFHQRFLRHLQHRKGQGTWILKCPDHVFALGAVRSVYPDARLVYLHRDPVEVLVSVAKLTEVLRRPFARSVDRAGIGRQVSERWAQGARILVDEIAANPAPDDRTVHLKFRDFVRNPLGTVAALYERFGLALSPEFVDSIRPAIAEQSNEGPGRHNGRLEDYGLDAQTERRRFRHYISCFGV
jgi:hypothetical protein